MKELTQEQIEKATKAAWEADGGHWADAVGSVKENWRKSIRAAAPYLQMPADMVTAEEIDRIMCGVTILKASHQGMRAIIDDLLLRRNAQLLPKEEDPRVEAAAIALFKRQNNIMDWDEMDGVIRVRYRKDATVVLEALDAMEAK